ncbi:MAG: efflux RND transporter permease subunit [bacterium]|nr:efflux RND transporter permease subunit [bacterium]
MNGAIRWFARNGVAANLLMVLIVVGGLMTVRSIKREVFPEFSIDLISVTVPYPGAAPEEVEEGVVVRIEEAIQGIDGIDDIRSTAAENAAAIIIEIMDDANLERVMNDVKSKVDAIDTFPLEAEEPVIEEIIRRTQVIEVVISGDADERTLKVLGERVRDDLSNLPEITQVQLVAARPYEVSIEISEQDLRSYGLTFDEVAAAVRRFSLDLPGGRIRSRDGEILLRTEGQAYEGPEFERLPLRTQRDGTSLLLGDVATVVDGFADTDLWSRFNGRPAVVVQVFRVGEQSALEVADVVKQYIAETRPRLPEGISLDTWHDETIVLRSRLDLLTRNGLAGFALVLLVLSLFLKLRLAGWVSLGIPISFLGAVIFMPWNDVSVNLISLFAFIVVLGIVVDDAIIVGENIHTEYESGLEGLEAAETGAIEVAKPVVFAVLTSVAAFAPLLAVTTTMGKVMRVVPIIVIATLMFSLVESLFILPNHLSHLKQEKPGAARKTGPWRRLQRRVSTGLAFLIENTYRPTLKKAIEWRYLTFAFGIAGLLLTFGVVRGGWVKFNFFPAVEADNTAAMLTLPQGTPAEVTAAAIERIEEAALELAHEIEEETGDRAIRHVLSSVGSQPFRAQQSRGVTGSANFDSPHLGEVTLELQAAEERRIGSTDIADRWRAKVGEIPGAVELTYSSSLFSSGEAVNIELFGPSLDHLTAVAQRLKEEIAAYPGTRDIADSFREGKREIELQLTREAELAGLTQLDLARQVRQAFYGEEAQRIQRGRDDVKVMVRYPESDRKSLADLEQMRIRSPQGAEVPLATAARTTLSRGPAAISRTNRNRVVNVTADVDTEIANTNEIIADLAARVLPRVLADYPEIRFSFEGEQEEQRKTMSDLLSGFMIALLVIYGLLAVPFRSYLQPLIVMSAIPFGLIGAVWGHVIMGLDLAILSMFGIVALTGVVVNDSLVLVSFINRATRRGATLREAILIAGEARFRPILLTSLTTFAGLTPLLLEKSMQAKFLVPMAVSLAFGVLFATFITLILVPSLYSIVEDVREGLGKLVAANRKADAKGVTA